MTLRKFAAMGVVLLAGWSGVASAAGFPNAQCTLNDDKSSMIVVASNTDDKAYNCLVSCRISVAGQRAFDPFKCNFSLRANANEKSVCMRKGSGPDHFTKVSSTKYTCAPR